MKLPTSILMTTALATTAILSCSGMSRVDLEPLQKTEIERSCTEGELDFRLLESGVPTSDAEVAGFAQCVPVAFCLAPRAAVGKHHPHRNLLVFFLLQTTRYAWKVSHPGAHAAARIGEDRQLQVKLGSWYPENQHQAGSAYAATFYQQPPGSRLRSTMVTEPPRIGHTRSRPVPQPTTLSKAEARVPLRVDVEVRVAHAPSSGRGAELFDFQGRLKRVTDRPKAMRQLRSGMCRFSVEVDGARTVLLARPEDKPTPPPAEDAAPAAPGAATPPPI